MKTISLTLVLVFLTINLYADKNWIQIEPINKTQTTKSKTKLDVNLSQNISVIKQLIDATSKKEKVATNDKNWFILKCEISK